MTTSGNGEEPRQLLQAVTPEVAAEMRAMVEAADHAALAVLDPRTGWPLASRVGLATMPHGTPLIVASALAPHFAALRADERCSLLVGAVGKGDPLAQPRATLLCRARMIEPDTPLARDARERYLAKHRRAAVYVDLPDFRFFELPVETARFNGGFGRAYELGGDALSG